MKSSNQLRGYRSIWRILRQRYSIIVRRYIAAQCISCSIVVPQASHMCKYLLKVNLIDLLECIHTSRDTVMRVLSNLDPEGVNQRARRRLKRRAYRSKVKLNVVVLDTCIIIISSISTGTQLLVACRRLR